MATKDWKKWSVKENVSRPISRKKGKTGGIVRTLYVEYIHLSGQLLWRFEVHNCNKNGCPNIISKSFESKAQAIKYAKAYMRKH